MTVSGTKSLELSATRPSTRMLKSLTTDQRWPAALCSEMRTAEAGRIPPGNLGLGPWGSHGETATKR